MPFFVNQIEGIERAFYVVTTSHARSTRQVVQLPMFNEKEVCQNIIDAACALEWPRSRVLIQVLDDSTCEETRRRIEDKVFEWKEKGINIVYRWRSNRSGYKAGAMHEAMADIENYEMCAIFDADFDPSPAGKTTSAHSPKP